MSLSFDQSTPLIMNILSAGLIILFIIAIIYTLVIKPRNAMIKRLLNSKTIATLSPGDIARDARDKIKKTVQDQIVKIKGKFIKIGNNFDDLSTELKQELSKCYQEGGCIF